MNRLLAAVTATVITALTGCSALSGSWLFGLTSTDPTSTYADTGAEATGQAPAGQIPADAPATITIVVAWALAQLGTPYAYGGDCTDAHGADPAHQCDCSSLTQTAYRAAGITIPRTAAAQSHTGSTVTDPTSIQPGDLIFTAGAYGTADSPGHVGMALGTDQLIHAPRTGDVVKIIDRSAWGGQIVAVRRIITG